MSMRFGEVAAANDTLAEAKILLAAVDTKLEARFTAEVAYLAICQAADVVAAHYKHQEPEGYTGRVEALDEFDEEFDTEAADLFRAARRLLHNECYHEGRCTGIQNGFDLATMLVDLVGQKISYKILPYPVSRNKPKKSKKQGRR